MNYYDRSSVSMSLDRLLSAPIDSLTSQLEEPPASGPAPVPFNEAQRLRALQGYGVLDTAAEQPYDDLVGIAAAVCRTPIALISLVDRDRSWFKARIGLEQRQTARNASLCAHAILRPDEVCETFDALQDPRFRDNPLVRAEPGVRFYAAAPLVSPDGMAIGTICVMDRRPRQLVDAERAALESLARQVIAQLQLRQVMADQRTDSMTDALTGAWNRRAFDRRLREEWSRHSRTGHALALLMIDVDQFGVFNDTHGTDAGDAVLQAAFRIAERSLRRSDFLARYRGQRFAVLLPDVDAAGAAFTADKLRLALERGPWPVGAVTASIGVAALRPGPSSDAHALVARADRALYVAQQRGRNCAQSFAGWD